MSKRDIEWKEDPNSPRKQELLERERSKERSRIREWNELSTTPPRQHPLDEAIDELAATRENQEGGPREPQT